MINRISTTATKWLDASYFLKFLLRLLGLYLLFRIINWLMIGLIVPGGYYSPFVDNYLNYVTVIKISVLQTGAFLAKLFGVNSFAVDHSTLQIVGAGKLIMAWACTGLEIMSFWAAFALADTTPLKTKLWWCFGGLFCIWLINSLRVMVLMIAVKNDWQEIGTLRHHDTFNIVAYSFVFLLMFIYYTRNSRAFAA
ncbi:MAG TPA: exosortase/archaeosortase family protein [Flavisolibacter sp.]|nr:exosortase/archaeosortase family protein [Flavisolibacter sp.]